MEKFISKLLHPAAPCIILVKQDVVKFIANYDVKRAYLPHSAGIFKIKKINLWINICLARSSNSFIGTQYLQENITRTKGNGRPTRSFT